MFLLFLLGKNCRFESLVLVGVLLITVDGSEILRNQDSRNHPFVSAIGLYIISTELPYF